MLCIQVIQVIPANQNKFLKLAQYFFSFWLVFLDWILGHSATYTMGQYKLHQLAKMVKISADEYFLCVGICDV